MIARLRPVPFDIGPVHFIGIGGIGMSGIAEIMLKIGYTVQGSDAKASANTERLQSWARKIFIGHDAAHVEGASAVVYSTAVKADNPEMVAARERRIPLVRRAEMLAELMRLQFSVAVGGTHGKTTTTSMVAALLDAGGLDPTVVNGGIINAYGTNAKVGDGDWIVVEADESDGTFLRLKSTVAIVTNIDPEHLDHYGDFDAVKKALPRLRREHPLLRLRRRLPRPSRGAGPGRAGREPPAGHLRRSTRRPRCGPSNVDMGAGRRRVRRGHHAARGRADHAATACACRWPAGTTSPTPSPPSPWRASWASADEAIRKRAWPGSAGCKRRFTTTGVVDGVRIVDDYGHHPVEIAAVLKAARAGRPQGRVIAVVQPHRYTRLRDLMAEFSSCFNDADTVIVADVYPPARRRSRASTATRLVEGLRRYGHRRVLPLEGPAALPALIAAEAKAGDLVVLLGAGDITSLGLRPAGAAGGAGVSAWRADRPAAASAGRPHEIGVVKRARQSATAACAGGPSDGRSQPGEIPRRRSGQGAARMLPRAPPYAMQATAADADRR